MKALIVYMSVSHGNTKKIADRIAHILNADLAEAKDIDDPNFLSKYDLVGFGSGIFKGKLHARLIKFVEKIPNQENKKSFIFSTSGTGKQSYHKEFKNLLQEKGFDIIAEHSSKALDTYGFFKLFGGINKGRPNDKDLLKAEEFAKNIKDKIAS
jgi:flavodoxin